MQEIIDEEFSAKTVVSVVHRLRFVDRYDRVAVMKNGALVECDRPQALLSVDSELKKLHDAMAFS
jgi:ATP-binding cassette, subfamily C (CFTR/MRP), member 1